MSTFEITQGLKTRKGFFSRLAAKAARYRVYRTTLDELNALSDRELYDLGIVRSQIRGIAHQAAFGG